MKQLPPLDALKQYHTKIHFFGLGFIQIKITETLRFHFYTKKLQSIMPVEEVHNHRYDFTSYILKGELTQRIYRPVPGETHIIVDVDCREAETPDPRRHARIMWTPQLMLSSRLDAGSEYTLPNFVFHQVESDFCVTRIEREPVMKERAGVLRKLGTEPVCPFSKKVPDDTLWEIVEDMLND